MASDLSRKIHNIMAREMGHLGKFIVSKQCKNLNIDEENIEVRHLDELSKALRAVMITFGGEDKARIIEDEIRKLI